MTSGNKINSVDAIGVLGEFDYSFSFEETLEFDRLRLIYAPNGRGKTNFLRAVDALISQSPESLQSLVEIPFLEISVEFFGGQKVQARRESPIAGAFTAKIAVGDECREFEVDPEDFDSRNYRRVWTRREDYILYSQISSNISSKSLYIGDDRLLPIIPDDSLGYGRIQRSPNTTKNGQGTLTNLLERIERMLIQQSLAAISMENEQASIYTNLAAATLEGRDTGLASAAREALQDSLNEIISKGEPLEKYGLFSTRQPKEILSQFDSQRQNDRRFKTLQTILSPYISSLNEQISSLLPVHSMIDTYITSVNNFLERKSMQFSSSRGIALVGANGSTILPESLSSGERHLLFLISQATLANESKSLIIIDEPEISLGIEWQRDLLPHLLKCSRFGEVQFILASHSLQVMNSVPLGEIVQPTEGAE